MTKGKLIDLVRAEKARPGVGETPLYLLHVIFPEQKRKRCWHRLRVRDDMGRVRQVVGDMAKALWLKLPVSARTFRPDFPVMSGEKWDDIEIHVCHGQRSIRDLYTMRNDIDTMVDRLLFEALLSGRPVLLRSLVGQPVIEVKWTGSSALAKIRVPYQVIRHDKAADAAG